MKKDKIRTLVAINDRIELNIIKKILEKTEDYEIIGQANDGEEELYLINKLKPELVIADFKMRKLSSMQVTKIIEKNIELYKKVKICILTKDIEQDLKKCERLNVFYIIIDRVTLEQYVNNIN